MNDAQIKAYKVRLCREANPEKYKTYAKEWQKANRDKCKVYMQNYYQRNKAARIAAARAWQAANPEKFKAMLRKAYVKRKAPPTLPNFPTMPKIRHTPKQMTNVVGNGTPLTLILTRPVTLDCARRLEAHRFQLFALNESGKTLQDAADAIGLTKETVRNYIEALGIDWKNLIRKPRKANNLPK